MLGARIRCGARWGDAAILNVSGSGLGLAASAPPSPGVYVELRRGAYVVVARVVWADGERFGVRAQDAILVDALVAAASCAPAAPQRTQRDRRSPPRTADREAASRAMARCAEFSLIGLFGAALALAAFHTAAEALGKPLARVSAALGPQ
jgi:hypothetical protein